MGKALADDNGLIWDTQGDLVACDENKCNIAH